MTGLAAAEPTPLRLSVQRTGSTAVLQVVGEVDVATCDRLRGRLRDLLEQRRAQPVRALVVDAAGLSFLDLTGLRVLLEAESELRHQGGSLVVRSPTRRVRRLLSLLDPERRLQIEGD